MNPLRSPIEKAGCYLEISNVITLLLSVFDNRITGSNVVPMHDETTVGKIKGIMYGLLENIGIMSVFYLMMRLISN